MKRHVTLCGHTARGRIRFPVHTRKTSVIRWKGVAVSIDTLVTLRYLNKRERERERYALRNDRIELSVYILKGNNSKKNIAADRIETLE